MTACRPSPRGLVRREVDAAHPLVGCVCRSRRARDRQVEVRAVAREVVDIGGGLFTTDDFVYTRSIGAGRFERVALAWFADRYVVTAMVSDVDRGS